MIDLNIENIERIRAAFARLTPEVKQEVLNGLAQAAYDAAQLQVDTHTQTGALRRSLELKPDGDSAWSIQHNLQTAPHAVFIHWGTQAHIIRPKEKKALRWVGERGEVTRDSRGRFVSGAKFIFARFVNHPGYRGDPWLVAAADEAVRQFDAIVRRVEGAFS